MTQYLLLNAMSDKINLSLDDIIAKESGAKNASNHLVQRVVKKDLKKDNLTKVVVKIDNDFNQTSNKRKVDFGETLIETTVGNTSTKGSASGHFPTTSGQIFVENLKYEVNDDDIQQLFGAFGSLKRAAVNYQNDGRSAGSAFVVFQLKSDAETAVNSLQGITLDGQSLLAICLKLYANMFCFTGRALHLSLINSNKSFARNSNDFNSRVKRQAIGSSGSGRQVWTDIARNYDSTPTEERNFRRSNRSDDNKAKEREVINAEDLDADLESYLAQRKKE